MSGPLIVRLAPDHDDTWRIELWGATTGERLSTAHRGLCRAAAEVQAKAIADERGLQIGGDV